MIGHLSRTHPKVFGPLAAFVLLAGSAAAQPAPGDAPPPPPGEAPRADAPPRDANPGRARAWVERMLNENHAREERLQDALDRLDKGDPPEKVLRALADRAREGAGPGGDGAERHAPRPRDRARNDGDRPGPPGDDRADAPDRDPPHPEGGGRGGPVPGGKGGRPGARLTPENRAEIQAFVKENMPVLARRIEMYSGAPQERERMLDRLAPRILDAMAAKRRDPELFECRVQEIQSGLAVFDAVKAYRDAAGDSDGADHASKLEEATKQLRDALEKSCDARDKVRAREIDLLAKRVDKMRAELAKQQGDRAKKVDEEFERIKKFGPKGPPPPRRDDNAGQ